MADDLESLAEFFGDAAEKVEAEVGKSMFRAGMNIKREAKRLAPKTLHTDDITFEVEKGADEIKVDVETRGVLGAIMEFGSPTMPGGKPFMGPALDKEAADIDKHVGSAVAKALRA